MDQLTSRLLLYGDLRGGSILEELAAVFSDWKKGACPKASLVRRTYDQVKRLLDLATDYGFDEDLWQSYLTFLLMTNENSFSLITERVGALEGSVNHFAENDFQVFHALFHYDFAPFEADLGTDCFSTLRSYRAIAKHERRYNKAVSEKVRDLRYAYAAFQRAFFAKGGWKLSITCGDALLVYLSIYKPEHLINGTNAEVERTVQKIWNELVSRAFSNREIAVVEDPKGTDQNDEI